MDINETIKLWQEANPDDWDAIILRLASDFPDQTMSGSELQQVLGIGNLDDVDVKDLLNACIHIQDCPGYKDLLTTDKVRAVNGAAAIISQM